jgi:hypothetical protein
MDLLIFAVIVLVLAVICVMLVEAIDKGGSTSPFARILILLVAVIVIAQRAGLF